MGLGILGKTKNLYKWGKSFQEKALDKALDKSYKINEEVKDRLTLKVGLILIFILCLITGSVDYYQYLNRPRYMEVPRVVTINGTDWGLIAVPYGNQTIWDEELTSLGAIAETSCETRIIHYRPNAPKLKSILWHEIAHAVACGKTYELHGNYFNINSYWEDLDPRASSLGHGVVYKIGAFIGEFERANPEFMNWKDY